MNKVENIKYWKLSFNILGLIPSVFIISLITFYIYYGLILGFGGVSSINPNEFPARNIYEYVIIISLIVTFFSALVFMALITFSILKKRKKELSRLIFIDSMLYLSSFLLLFSNIFEFVR